MTNGFDINTVLSALSSRIGWQQPTQVDSVALDEDNLTSDSGRYFQQFHPMLTLQNLRATIEDEKLNDMQFNGFLADLKKGVITSVLNAVFNRSQQLESTLIYDRLRRNDNLTTNSGKFVGYRLWSAPGSYAIQISQASFLLTANATFNLYLFHDAVTAPLYTLPVTVVGGSETIIELADWIVKYIDKAKQVQGGVYYIGYFQNDLPSGCVAIEQYVNEWNKTYVFGYTAFEAVANGSTDFVRNSVPYTYRTYGMNLEIQAYRDYTNWIIKNKSLFDEVIGLAFSVVALGYMTYSTRTNFTQRITQQLAQNIYNEINANGSYVSTPYIAGLKKQIEREISRLQDNAFHDPAKSNELTSTRPNEWA